ncbi:MAG: FAD-binding protein [Rhodobacteraceae bacterium]|nr:FAD-binding protein [Paracoccaceae bacterium]MCP5342128.1 FAD-binding protein [Paracoccaceae bacterium]
MKPQSETELAEMIREANGPLRIVGGGTRPVGRPLDCAPLDVSSLAGITLHEPGALTLVAKAGTPLAEVTTALAAQGQRLAFEPSDWRELLGTSGEPTIGGMVAANISGPRRVQVGACRDALLGVRFVDGTGTVVKNGGRVMKNVTGYDLVKLMAGSWGTLGVLTEVALKVLPAPEAAATLVYSGVGWADASQIFAKALKSPYEITGAARLPEMGKLPSRALIRLEGLAGSVEYRAGKLAETLQGRAPERILRGAENDRAWACVRDLEAFAGAAEDVWRISVRPTDMMGIVGRLSGARIQLDWGGGLVWAGVPEGIDLRAGISPFSGHATLIRGSEETRAKIASFHPESAPVAALSAGIRARFDPKGILNPGLMD